MTFKTAIRTCFGKYATFKGRATRPEYWYFVLFIVLGGIATSIIDGALFGAAAKNGGDGPVSTLFSLGTFIPLVQHCERPPRPRAPIRQTFAPGGLWVRFAFNRKAI